MLKMFSLKHFTAKQMEHKVFFFFFDKKTENFIKNRMKLLHHGA